MLFNRHFTIIVLSILFIGVVFWWQKPDTTVSAMAGGEYSSNSYIVVKNYFKKMDYRQFDLAAGMTTVNSEQETADLKKMLNDNPFLSIQKITVMNTDENTFIAEIVLGSSIDEQQTVSYQIDVISTENGWLINSIKAQ